MVSDPIVLLIGLSLAALVVFIIGVGSNLGPPGPARGGPSSSLGEFLLAARAAQLDPSGRQLAGLSYAGTSRGGRRTGVSFSAVAGSAQVHLSVSMRRDVPSLRVRHEGSADRKKGRRPKENVQTGDRAFDDRFFLQSSAPEEGRRVLGPQLRQAITRAFTRPGVQRLVLERGQLSVTADLDALPPAAWEDFLATLDDAAALFETTPMNVRVLGGERDVVVDPEGKTRCAYCRDGITGEEDDLVACERCRTVLHDACWAEHGGCPMLGCEGKAPERARVGYGEPS